MAQGNRTTPPAPAAAGQRAVRWDTAGMKNSYCNLANASATGEAVVLNFGLSQTVEHGRAELSVDRLQRIVLNPLVAKHLHDLLSKLTAEYDAHHGNPG